MMARRRSAVLMAFALAALGCASSRPGEKLELTERIDRALDEIIGSCGVAFAGDQRNFRELYGMPICREQRLGPSYRDALRYDAAGGIGYQSTSGSCGSTIGGVNAKSFDAALTEYMSREGFYEAAVIYVTVCSKSVCNGESLCNSSSSRREFYRPSDKLRVIAVFGDRNYPRVHRLGVEQGLEDHSCADPERSAGCFPPGMPRY